MESLPCSISFGFAFSSDDGFPRDVGGFAGSGRPLTLASRMSTASAARGRAGIRDRTMATVRVAPVGSRSLVSIGFFSVLLGVPLAVVWEASGPYDDPKTWALPILVM